MSRKIRMKSGTGVYHCIIRGNNKQDIFYDKEDYWKLKKELIKTKEKYNYEIYSYAFMPNHIHLQIKTNEDNLSKIMQSLQIRYNRYFIKKYDYTGHLSQGRFYSKCVENEQYILDLQRYIHQNPMKAKISTIEDYEWSSYSAYIKNSKYENIVNSEYVLKLFDENEKIAISKFIEFNKEIVKIKDSEKYLEYEIRNTLKDEEAVYFINKQLKIKNISNIKNYEKKIRNLLVKEITKIKGINTKQISRILGISSRIIERIKMDK